MLFHSRWPRGAIAGGLRARLWQGLGWLAICVATLALIVPLLPTTPFLLLAAAAFGRGSPRLRARIVANPRMGPMLAAWEAQRAIPRKGKRMAYGAMAAGLALATAIGTPMLFLALQAVASVLASLFIATRPDGLEARTTSVAPPIERLGSSDNSTPE